MHALLHFGVSCELAQFHQTGFLTVKSSEYHVDRSLVLRAGCHFADFAKDSRDMQGKQRVIMVAFLQTMLDVRANFLSGIDFGFGVQCRDESGFLPWRGTCGQPCLKLCENFVEKIMFHDVVET